MTTNSDHTVSFLVRKKGMIAYMAVLNTLNITTNLFNNLKA